MAPYSFTLAVMRSKLQNYVDDPDGNRWTDAVVDGFINEAQQQVVIDTMDNEHEVRLNVPIADIKEVTDGVIATTAIGDVEFAVVATWGTVVANAYQYKYFSAIDGNDVTRDYLIGSHTAAVGGSITFTLFDPLPAALVTAETTITIKPTPGRIRLDNTNVPGYCGVIRKLEYDDGDGYDGLDYANKEDMDWRYSNDRGATGIVSHYWFTRYEGDTYLNLFKVPAQAGTIRIIYPRMLEELSSDSDVSSLLLVFHPAMLTYAKALISDDRRDVAEANRQYSRYEAQIDRATTFRKREDLSKPRRIYYSD